MDRLGAEYFGSQGFVVVDHGPAPLRGHYGEIHPGQVYEWARRKVPPSAEAVFIGGSGFRAIDAIATLEEDLGRPELSAIQELIARQFSSLSWAPGKSADWEAFAADFYPHASLYPATRPARRQTVKAFVERMRGLAAIRLRCFKETILGAEIRVFGNVAMALAACEMTENDADVNRGVEALLRIKNEAAWQIVSRAWDTEGESSPIPVHLVGGTIRG